MNSLFHATFSWLSAVVVSFKNSLYIFTQDEADASVRNTCCKLKLVFLEKRLQFSGRQYFEIRWGFYIKLKVSWLRAFLWCMSQTSRDRDNSVRVRTHKKISGDVLSDWAQRYKAFFVPNREPASAWIFGNGPVRVGAQGLFHPHLKTFVPPYCPWVSEDGVELFHLYLFLRHKKVYDANGACDQRFLSCMAFNVCQVFRVTCLRLYVCFNKKTNYTTDRRPERLRKRQKPCSRETYCPKVK